MTNIDGHGMGFTELNEAIRRSDGVCRITGLLGQRFLCAGMSDRSITLEGIPGNALGAYLNGGSITVRGNAQDAVGDTMNDGSILIHGSVGDAAGYAMRGGEIYVQGSAGYRAGIHMKQYGSKIPLLVIGGRAGSFLGEYQAGGVILVLGLHKDGKPIVSNFPCTGMHGGKLILRGDAEGILFPAQVTVSRAEGADLDEIKGYLRRYADLFGADYEALSASPYPLVKPSSNDPYRQMYVAN